MSDTSTFTLDIVTPERKVFSGNAELAIFPGADGEFGIMPHHAAMVSVLNPGEIKVTITIKQKFQYFAISGGFLEVRDNSVTVVADTAEPAAEIDIQRARHSKETAENALLHAGELMSADQAHAQIKRADVRLKVAQRAV
jgi:F-type H+-transporting ATPase subunit epsilon